MYCVLLSLQVVIITQHLSVIKSSPRIHITCQVNIWGWRKRNFKIKKISYKDQGCPVINPGIVKSIGSRKLFWRRQALNQSLKEKQVQWKETHSYFHSKEGDWWKQVEEEQGESLLARDQEVAMIKEELTELASQPQGSSYLCLPSTGIMGAMALSFHVHADHLNSGPCACVARNFTNYASSPAGFALILKTRTPLRGEQWHTQTKNSWLLGSHLSKSLCSTLHFLQATDGGAHR